MYTSIVIVIGPIRHPIRNLLNHLVYCIPNCKLPQAKKLSRQTIEFKPNPYQVLTKQLCLTVLRMLLMSHCLFQLLFKTITVPQHQVKPQRHIPD